MHTLLLQNARFYERKVNDQPALLLADKDSISVATNARSLPGSQTAEYSLVHVLAKMKVGVARVKVANDVMFKDVGLTRTTQLIDLRPLSIWTVLLTFCLT